MYVVYWLFSVALANIPKLARRIQGSYTVLASRRRAVGHWHKNLKLLFLCFLVSSCGFHLKGFAPIPAWFDSVYIIPKNTDPFLLRYLNHQLISQSMTAVPDLGRANYLLILEDDGFQQQMTSVSASTTPRQYQLIYTLHYTLLTKAGVKLRPSDTVVVVRLLTINNNRILGSNHEETTIKHEMIRAATSQLIRQIAVTNVH